MANQVAEDSSFSSPRPSGQAKRRSLFWKGGLLFLLLALAGGVVYYFQKDPAPEKPKGVYTTADGSVPGVEAYIKQNLLQDPESFVPVHWSKLQRMVAFGDTTYKVGLIYKAKNTQNEVVMYSKLFELAPDGMVLFVMDVPPMENK